MQDRTIKIYSTPACHFCHEAKGYFAEKGVSFEEINVVGNLEKISELRKISGGSSVPVIVIGDYVLVGWNKDKFDAAYEEIFSGVT